MTEAKIEVMPEAAALIEQVQFSTPFDLSMRKDLEELFKNKVFRAALRAILVASDDQLKNIGQTDLTNELAIKNALRAQGHAQGLVAGVELLCTLASTPENESAEENDNG